MRTPQAVSEISNHTTFLHLPTKEQRLIPTLRVWLVARDLGTCTLQMVRLLGYDSAIVSQTRTHVRVHVARFNNELTRGCFVCPYP